ncbi:MAG: hypothetical protein K2G54_03395 [Malacoplasma sp.]|nr:hypothetical protein [Malacoplasma sp.]
MFRNCFVKIIYPYDDIISFINKISNNVNAYYKSFNGEEIVIIAVLEGSIAFAGYLLMTLDFNVIFKSLKVVSEDSTNPSKRDNLKVVANIKANEIKNKRVLIIDTLMDTGKTLHCVYSYVKDLEPKDIKICTLFKKDKSKDEDFIKSPNKALLKLDWYGATIPNQWVAGFGLDSRNKYRNIKHLGVVRIEKR